MKKLILLLIIPLFMGCAGYYKQASHTSNQLHIGMSISQFKIVAGKKATIEAMEAGYTVFKMHDYEPWYGLVTDTKFFYFDSSWFQKPIIACKNPADLGYNWGACINSEFSSKNIINFPCTFNPKYKDVILTPLNFFLST